MTRLGFIRSRLLAAPPHPLTSAVFAVAFVAAPTVLRALADPLIAGSTFSTYYPFVLIAGIYVGSRGAAGVALASALVANFLFMDPRYVLFGRVQDTLTTLLFLISCCLMILLVDTLRRTLAEVEHGRRREAQLNGDLRHLNGELQHRVKNTLAVVQGLAHQTFRSASGIEDAVRAFRGRLHALGEAHAVLTAGRWEVCQLPDLAVRAVAPFNVHGAIHLEGPACSLPEHTCVPLVLALHELGVNAVKYGALSTLDGTVEVEWALIPAANDAGAAQLVLEWSESGGPPVQQPGRQGLGSKLIAPQRGIDAAMMDFRPHGLFCRITAAGAIAVVDD